MEERLIARSIACSGCSKQIKAMDLNYKEGVTCSYCHTKVCMSCFRYNSKKCRELHPNGSFGQTTEWTKYHHGTMKKYKN